MSAVAWLTEWMDGSNVCMAGWQPGKCKKDGKGGKFCRILFFLLLQKQNLGESSQGRSSGFL